MENIDWVEIIKWAGVVIGAASVIAATTKNTWDNKVLDVLRKVVDFVALNFGNAKNEKK